MAENKPYFAPLPVNEITERRTDQIFQGGGREKQWREIVGPLFDAGIEQLAIARLPSYDSGSTKILTNKVHRISLMVQGQMTFVINDESFTVGPGSLVVTPAGSSYFRRAHGPIEWLYMRVANQPRWSPFRKRGGYSRLYESADHMYLLARRILDGHRDRDTFSVRCTLENCQVLLMLLERELAIPDKKATTRIQQMADICDRIRKDPAGDWSRPVLAQELNVADRHLTRVFQKHYGRSPAQMVTEIRVQCAAERLVNTDESVEAIAAAVGYQSPFGLRRSFLRHMGISPSAYRNKCR